MAVYTNAISSSVSSGIVELSGSIRTSGFLSALGVGNASTIDVSIDVPETYNFLLYGPITISSSGKLYIANDSVVKIKDIEDV